MAQRITSNPSCEGVCRVARSFGAIFDYLSEPNSIQYDEYIKAKKNIVNDLENDPGKKSDPDPILFK